MGKDGGGSGGGGYDWRDHLAEEKPGYKKMMSDRKRSRNRGSSKIEFRPFTFMGLIKALLNLE